MWTFTGVLCSVTEGVVFIGDEVLNFSVYIGLVVLSCGLCKMIVSEGGNC